MEAWSENTVHVAYSSSVLNIQYDVDLRELPHKVIISMDCYWVSFFKP